MHSRAGMLDTIGLQAVVGTLARSGAEAFDLREVLKHLAEAAVQIAGARGVAIERAVNGNPTEAVLISGLIAGSPRRVPIISEGRELGFIAVYGTAMFGPATAERTQFIADLAAIALTRAEREPSLLEPLVDETRYRLITGVGMNLRNTLGAATGYVQLVEMEGELNFAQTEYSSRSRRAIGAAVALISDLLELTRADAGKLNFDSEPVNLHAIAREGARKHEKAANAKGARVSVVTDTRNPVVMTDSSHVQQIVDVLVYNAVRYTKPQTEVTITVGAREGRRATDPRQWLCIAVQDRGGGVPVAEHVFEEVHRVEQANGNVRFKLAICRRVARLLGGDLTVDSEKDVGSSFTLWLPAPAE